MILKDKQAIIHEKGFEMQSQDFSKIMVGKRKLEDAIYDLISARDHSAQIRLTKERVFSAIERGDLKEMRIISDYIFKTSGIYSRLCRYLAYFYKYDWMLSPYDVKKEGKEKQIEEAFYPLLSQLERFGFKKFFNEVALKVVKNGCYYGIITDSEDGVWGIQELPPEYCRVRFYQNRRPVVEFLMRYFDDKFKDVKMRERILEVFPDDFKLGYKLYKQGKLPAETSSDSAGWFALDPNMTFKFNLNENDSPFLMTVIPPILDLADAQDLDREKTAQKLIKLIIQKLPIDKNGDLVFDVDEAQMLHNNAATMVGDTVGLKVLTTFADTEVEDLSDTGNQTATDDLERVERTVYNEAGISQMQFNTSGNMALDRSLLNDAATMYTLIAQFEEFMNQLLIPINKKNKQFKFRINILTTTIYNYLELAKAYKEQTSMGFSKMLPQIALGHSQSTILANAYFENEVLDLVNVFIPPLTSNVMNQDILDRATGKEKEGGRPEKPDSEKSEKTIQNIESQS